MLKAVEVGHAAVAGMCVDMEAWAKQVGKPKSSASAAGLPEGLQEKVEQLVGQQLRDA